VLLRLPRGAALGMRWLALTEEEQRLRLRDLLGAILAHAAAGEQARFRVVRRGVEARSGARALARAQLSAAAEDSAP
jgi:hypothetical protein